MFEKGFVCYFVMIMIFFLSLVYPIIYDESMYSDTLFVIAMLD